MRVWVGISEGINRYPNSSFFQVDFLKSNAYNELSCLWVLSSTLPPTTNILQLLLPNTTMSLFDIISTALTHISNYTRRQLPSGASEHMERFLQWPCSISTNGSMSYVLLAQSWHQPVAKYLRDVESPKVRTCETVCVIASKHIHPSCYIEQVSCDAAVDCW